METNTDLELLLASCWPVGDPFELNLYVGALCASSWRPTSYLDEELIDLIERCIVRWRPRAHA